MTRARETILQEIACEEERLAELERAREEAQARRESLESELAGATTRTPELLPLHLATSGRIPQTPAEKVRLFRSLFRGREDVFPTRFVSKKSGNPGYAPECSNKFVSGVCILKTGGKCSECPNQSFLPVGDQVVLDHLQGRHVMGVYPLLEDETCWFLAADFDESSWKDDVVAFAETCRVVGVPSGDRALPLGKRRPCMVLLRLARARERREADGLLPHHRDDEPPSRTQHGILRPPLPEPGHHASGWIRKPDRAAATARAEEAWEQRLCRWQLEAFRGSVGVPRVRAASGAGIGRNDRERSDPHRPGRRSSVRRNVSTTTRRPNHGYDVRRADLTRSALPVHCPLK